MAQSNGGELLVEMLERAGVHQFFTLMVAGVKELEVRFSFGYSPQEFAQTLHALAEGRIEAEPLITGRSGLEGVAAAFEDLAQPDRHAKILVEPGR